MCWWGRGCSLLPSSSIRYEDFLDRCSWWIGHTTCRTTERWNDLIGHYSTNYKGTPQRIIQGGAFMCSFLHIRISPKGTALQNLTPFKTVLCWHPLHLRHCTPQRPYWLTQQKLNSCMLYSQTARTWGARLQNDDNQMKAALQTRLQETFLQLTTVVTHGKVCMHRSSTNGSLWSRPSGYQILH